MWPNRRVSLSDSTDAAWSIADDLFQSSTDALDIDIAGQTELLDTESFERYENNDCQTVTINDKVKIKIKNKKWLGYVRYIGELISKKGIFYGIELNQANKGRNNGTFQNKFYFETKDKRGIFVKRAKIEKLSNIKNKNDLIRVTVGDKVFIKKFDCNGILRFIGNIINKNGIWYGIELEKPKGKNNGSIDKHIYFKCKDKYGTFQRAKSIQIIKQAPVADIVLPILPQSPMASILPSTSIFFTDSLINSITAGIDHDDDNYKTDDNSPIDIKRFLENIISNDFCIDTLYSFSPELYEYLLEDDNIHLLMMYVSRMNKNIDVWKDDCLLNDLKIDYNDIIPNASALVSNDINEVDATKLSYTVMRILEAGRNTNQIIELLSAKYKEICLHALSVFHPLSSGNVYHGRVILEILLQDNYLLFLECLCNTNNTKIQLLFKNAMFRCLHQGNMHVFGSSLLGFVFPKDMDNKDLNDRLFEFKTKLINMLTDWKYIEYLLNIISSSQHGDDISVKYAIYFIDWMSELSSLGLKEIIPLYIGNENIIIDSFISILINNKDLNLTTWQRSQCGHNLMNYIDVISRKYLNEWSFGNPLNPMSSPNVLYPMLNQSFNKLISYIPNICNIIINENKSIITKQINLSCGTLTRPLGSIRLICFELLTLIIDLSHNKWSEALSKISFRFWNQLLNMLFIHNTHNIFCTHFRRLIHLIMIFRRRILKYLFIKQNMFDRFVDFYYNGYNPSMNLLCYGFIRSNISKFALNIYIPIEIYNLIFSFYTKYNKNLAKSALHGYIVQIIYDTYNHDAIEKQKQEQEEKEKEKQTQLLAQISSCSAINFDDNNDIDDLKDLDNDDDKDNDNDNVNDVDIKITANMSSEPEDEWDIAEYLNKHKLWNDFNKIITIEMEARVDTMTVPNTTINNSASGGLDGLLEKLLASNYGDVDVCPSTSLISIDS